MSTTAAPNTDEEPPSLFSTLPNDLVLNVLARVPRRYHPILSRVSKKLRSLVRSSELRKTRSLLGRDSFYVCFKELAAPSLTYHWFALTDKRLVSTRFPSQPEPYSFAVMVGPEIYFVGGNYSHLSKSMWILDSRSGKLRQGPSMRVARRFTVVGLVDEKIYVFGCHQDKDEEIQGEVFDPKTQTWEVAAPTPSLAMRWIHNSMASPSLGIKIYVKTYVNIYVNFNAQEIIVYDPRDGRCEKIEMTPDSDVLDIIDFCVIDNLVYVYSDSYGLMWYDSKGKEWKMVTNGLILKKYPLLFIHAMADYNGKLALFAAGSCQENNEKEIWCAMIALDRSGVEIMGKLEWFDPVLSVPYYYFLTHCLGRTD